MEFEQMKKIWDEQKQEALYVINEEALHDSIRAKKAKAHKMMNWNEIGLILINLGVGCKLIITAIANNEGPIDYIGGGIMFLIALYILVIRTRRIKSERQFDRSILGEIDHAISTTQSNILLGTSMVWWYFLPIVGYLIAKMIYVGVAWYQWLFIAGMMVLGRFVAGLEIKKWHKPRLQKLQSLRMKLLEEVN
jgi:hypothetical protein